MKNKCGSLNDYFSRLLANFDESTILFQNKNGEKENGQMDRLEIEFKKNILINFSKNYSISINELLLAGLTLTLNKFNFSSETLIFNHNNVPFATKFENRTISLKEFLKHIHENYIEMLEFDEYVDDEDFSLKPEFYYSFNQEVCDIECLNYLSMIENDKSILIQKFHQPIFIR